MPRWPGTLWGVERVLDGDGSFQELARREFGGPGRARPHRSGTKAQVLVSSIASSGDGRLETYTYLLETDTTTEELPPKEEPGELVSNSPSTQSPRVSRALQEKLDFASDEERIPILLVIGSRPETPLGDTFEQTVDMAFGNESESLSDRLARRVAARKSEIEQAHAQFRAGLEARGFDDSKLESFWLTGSLGGELTAGEISTLLEESVVRKVAFDAPSPPANVSNKWDGWNLYWGNYYGHVLGLNVHHYTGGGIRGRYYHSSLGRYTQLGYMDDGFQMHSILDDYHGQGGWGRINNVWDCTSSSCPSVYSPADSGTHGTFCLSAAMGDATQGQVPSIPSSERQDYTGVATEAEAYAAYGQNVADTNRSIQKMIDAGGMDVFLTSRDSNGACRYDWEMDDINTGYYDAHTGGILAVSGAGNLTTTGCNLSHWGQALSSFTVAGTDDPTDLCYDDAPLTNWSQGPSDAKTYVTPTLRASRSGALNGVDAVVPGWWWFGADLPDTFVNGKGGTSVAGPQVAGAALLVKEAYLRANITYINAAGVLFTQLLAMTDRENGAAHRTWGFSPEWGGGRFQLRYFGSGADHPDGGAWAMDLFETYLYDDQTVDIPVRGTGTEPTSLNQIKVYAMVFEEDWEHVADIDLRLRGSNCAGTTYGDDIAFDVKSMVRAGSEAAGDSLCVQVHGYGVPTGGRRVVLAMYYSVDTLMR